MDIADYMPMIYREYDECDWKEKFCIIDRMSRFLACIRFIFVRQFINDPGKGSMIYSSFRAINLHKISIGSNVEIKSHCMIDARSTYNPSIIIGDCCRIKEFVNLSSYGGKIFLGKNVLIGAKTTIHGHGNVFLDEYSGVGPHVVIVSSNHVFDNRHCPWQVQGEKIAPVRIMRNAWVGAGSIILAGTTIGEGAVIGAGSVVVNDIPAHAMAVGVPCCPKKILRNTS